MLWFLSIPNGFEQDDTSDPRQNLHKKQKMMLVDVKEQKKVSGEKKAKIKEERKKERF